MAHSSGNAPAWRKGEVVDDRYRMTWVPQEGAMGVVYRVRHLAWDIDLAAKSPRPELLRDEKDRERFAAEAETWVSLGLNPHVCHRYYVRFLADVPRVFAEYVAGGSLCALEQAVERLLVQPLDRTLLAGRFADGTSIRVEAAAGELTCTCVDLSESAR